MIGARGSVGSTVALGLAALRKKLVQTTGLVTELPVFRGADLPDPRCLVVGGHEIRSESFAQALQGMRDRANLFDTTLLKACQKELARDNGRVRPGTLVGTGNTVRKLADRSFCRVDSSPAAAVERLSADIRSFRVGHRLDHVVVVHVASSEPPARPQAAFTKFSRLTRELAKRESKLLPTSSLYSLAAIEAGAAFINFTPSLGMRVPAIRARADQLGVPYMGSDGKTGETLVKSVLAPMFAMRNLNVLSWFGQNILGNRDGAVLTDPPTRQSKVRSKDGLVRRILGARTATHVGIDYVPSLDDWKVAWDFIHFEGFLNTKMTMQFVWHGADSILAAPLIIDLARLAALELRAGRRGPMKHLAFFFKDPLDADEHDLPSQWRRLVAHLQIRTTGPKSDQASRAGVGTWRGRSPRSSRGHG